MNEVLEKNKCISFFREAAKFLKGEPAKNQEDPEVARLYELVRFAPLVSCDVERSFSMFKNVLSDNRKKFTVENLEKFLVVHCNASIFEQDV